MYKGKKIAVVIPAYNEEVLIGSTLNSMPDFFDKIYTIDDGSVDNTFAIIQTLAAKNDRIVPIRHVQNRGVGGAIVTGYKLSLADGIDIVAVMAGDNQMDPIYLPSLLDPIIDNKADYAKGNRLANFNFTKGMSMWRRLGNFILTLLTKISSGYWNISDPQNGYTTISRKALEAIDLDSVYCYYGYCNDLLAKLNVLGMKVIDVPIPARYSNEKSKIKYGKYIINVSRLLIRNFFWRIKKKYIMNHIPGFQKVKIVKQNFEKSNY